MLRELQRSRQRSAKLERSAFHGFSRQQLNDPETLPPHAARIAFRDVARATDSRTVRAALVPPKIFITNTAPYFVWHRGDEKDHAFLLGVLCSLPLDWYARRFVEIHLNYHVLDPFPVPRPSRGNPLWGRTVELAGRLACPDRRFARWAKAVGGEHGKFADEEKRGMIYELDAVVAHLYGLSEPQLRHVFETFHEGWELSQSFAAEFRHPNKQPRELFDTPSL